MSQTRQLLALTEAIYDAAGDGVPWTTAEAGLRDMMRARTATLIVGDLAAGRAELLWREGFSDKDVALYQAHYRHLDLWTTRTVAAVSASGSAAAGVNAPVQVLIGGEKRVPDAEYVRSTFYNEFGRQRGMRYVIGTVVPLGEAGLMPLACHRPDGAPTFGEAERRILLQAAPHLRRALQLRHRLRAVAGTASRAALDAMPLGVVVVDAAMRVVVANAAAEALAGLPGAALRLQRARLIAGGGDAGVRTMAAALHAAEATRLEDLVCAVAARGEAGGAMRLTAGDGLPSLAVMVSPLPKRLAGVGGDGRVAGQALLLLRDLTMGRPAPPRADLLRELFGLTRAEAEVARALAGGHGTPVVAAQRGLKDTTVRSQARAILAKTGAANLREFERMMAGLQGM
jgi:PAS domain-containing protein/DNA-binding CsgD family transcriptional regulator